MFQPAIFEQQISARRTTRRHAADRPDPAEFSLEALRIHDDAAILDTERKLSSAFDAKLLANGNRDYDLPFAADFGDILLESLHGLHSIISRMLTVK